MSDLSRSENLYKVSKSVVIIEDKSNRIDHSKLKELFPVNSWCIKYNLYADSQPTTYFYCIKPVNLSYDDFFECICSILRSQGFPVSSKASHTIPVAVYDILVSNKHLDEITENNIIEHTDEWVEIGMVPLIKSLMTFPGIEIIESCNGHYNPNDPTYEDWICYAWVLFKVDSISSLNKLTSSLKRSLTQTWQYFQLDDREDWPVKNWYINNGVLLSFAGTEDDDTMFEITFRYEANQQSQIFKIIDYLGRNLQSDELQKETTEVHV